MASLENVESLPGLTVSLVYSPAARQVREWTLTLDPGATVATALALSRVLEAFPALKTERLTVGIWGRKSSLSQLLQDRDRIEIYRPLQVDPMVARRERFVRQGAKSAGLFSKTRAGAKAGY